MNRRELATLCIAALVWPLPGFTQQSSSFSSAVQAFINMMVNQHGFDRSALEKIFTTISPNAKVVDLIKPAAAGGRKIWWDEYRSRHVTVRNISAGILFYKKHQQTLAAATERYGVPGNIITAIIGIETRYGSYTGNYRSVEALSTLAFSYPPRADYFAGELEQLFLYARQAGVNITDLRGSYAGAMGLAQFMPTSARTWAVDFDGDGTIDLFNYADAIGSVANFLTDHGWVRDTPVAYPVTTSANAKPQLLLSDSIKPALDPTDFAAAGLTIDFGATTYQDKLALVDLVSEASTEYRAGTINYYVLTRYNRSNKYAMAVLDLATAIGKRV